MKKRRAKSRMTRVDLDAVLKLQRDYTELQMEVKRLQELAYRSPKEIANTKGILMDNEDIGEIMMQICIMAKRIQYLEQQLEQARNEREVESSGV